MLFNFNSSLLQMTILFKWILWDSLWSDLTVLEELKQIKRNLFDQTDFMQDSCIRETSFKTVSSNLFSFETFGNYFLKPTMCFKILTRKFLEKLCNNNWLRVFCLHFHTHTHWLASLCCQVFLLMKYKQGILKEFQGILTVCKIFLTANE